MLITGADDSSASLSTKSCLHDRTTIISLIEDNDLKLNNSVQIVIFVEV
jgi:hypothetical protein